MENIIHINGIDSNIYNHLIFKDLINLRKCSTKMCVSINDFSINIIKDLIYQYNKTYVLSFKKEFMDYKDTIYTIIYGFYKEIDFLKNFIQDRKIYNSFMTKIKETKFLCDKGGVKNTISQYEMMYSLEKKQKEKIELDKKVNSEGYQNWVKKDGKWVVDSITPLEEDDKFLIKRSVNIYEHKLNSKI